MRCALLASLVLLVACDDEAPPLGGGGGPVGGGGGGGVSRPDAPPGPDAPDGRLRGLVCLVTDVRVPESCATVTDSNLTVTVVESGAAAGVAADGSFDLPSPGGVTATIVSSADDNLYYGAALRTGGEGGAGLRLRVMLRDAVLQIHSGSGRPLLAGTGLLAVRVVDDGQPVEGAQLSTEQAEPAAYDSGDPDIFLHGGATGASGTALYFGLAPGDLTVRATSGAQGVDVATFVSRDAIVFVTAAL